MKEHPILFSTPMVKAILDGNKTMTRRIVKFPKDFTGGNVFPNGSYGLKYTSNMGGDTVQRLSCPYGEIGDRLWVRETFAEAWTGSKMRGTGDFVYRADWGKYDIDWKSITWTPSLHMPRNASRLLLEITDIRVERLNDITEEDAKKEGIREGNTEPVYPPDFTLCPECGGELVHKAFGDNYGVTEIDCTTCDTYKKRFKILWEQLNGVGSWDTNPWVWVVNFKRI